MPLAVPTSRRFLSLLVAGVLVAPAEAGPLTAIEKDIPKYCRLLNELAPDQRAAYVHDFENEHSGKPLDQWTREDDRRLDERLRLLERYKTIPLDKRLAIENAYRQAHPDAEAEHGTILQRLMKGGPNGEELSRKLWSHSMKIHRQVGRDCELQLG